MKDRLDDPKYPTYQQLPNIIRNAVNILEKHNRGGILKRRFKNLKDAIYVNRTKIMLLTLSMAVSNHSKYSYTNLAIKLDNSIAFHLFI